MREPENVAGYIKEDIYTVSPSCQVLQSQAYKQVGKFIIFVFLICHWRCSSVPIIVPVLYINTIDSNIRYLHLASLAVTTYVFYVHQMYR